MEIYLYQNETQVGPYTEQQLCEGLSSGSVKQTDLAWHEGLAEWQPLNVLFSIEPALPAPPPPPISPPPVQAPPILAGQADGNTDTSGRFKGEVRLLEQYGAEVDKLVDQLAEEERDPDAQKPIQRMVEQKMQIYWKQIERMKADFPQAAEARLHHAAYLTSQAIVLVCGSGMMRRICSRSGGSAGGVAAKIASGLIAKQQERANASKALALLDQALGLSDYPGAHFCKAQIQARLGQQQEALTALNYVIANFPDDEVYVTARKMKDEIENPPKKSGCLGCFIATAAFGSPLAAEVVFLSDFRDEVLLRSRLGRWFVAVYYRLSPPLAAVIGRSQILKAATRTILLAPILHVLKGQFASPARRLRAGVARR